MFKQLEMLTDCYINHELVQLIINYFNLLKQKADNNHFCNFHKLHNCDQCFKNVGLDIKARKSNLLKQWQVMEMFDILKQYTIIINLKLMRITT